MSPCQALAWIAMTGIYNFRFRSRTSIEPVRPDRRSAGSCERQNRFIDSPAIMRVGGPIGKRLDFYAAASGLFANAREMARNVPTFGSCEGCPEVCFWQITPDKRALLSSHDRDYRRL